MEDDKNVFTMHDVDYIEIEVLQLPIVSVSMDFLYRFCKPIETIISREPIRLAHTLSQIDNRSYEERLKEEVIVKWREMFDGNQEVIDAITCEEAKEKVNKLYNISEVKIHYLDLVRK